MRIDQNNLALNYSLELTETDLLDIGTRWENILRQLGWVADPQTVLAIQMILLLFSRRELEDMPKLPGGSSLEEGLLLLHKGRPNGLVNYLKGMWRKCVPHELFDWPDEPLPGNGRTAILLRNMGVRFPLGDRARHYIFSAWAPQEDYSDRTQPYYANFTLSAVAKAISAQLDKPFNLSRNDWSLVLDLLGHRSASISDAVSKYLPRIPVTEETANGVKAAFKTSSGKNQRKCIKWILGSSDFPEITQATLEMALRSHDERTRTLASSHFTVKSPSADVFLTSLDKKSATLSSLQSTYGVQEVETFLNDHFLRLFIPDKLPLPQVQMLSRLVPDHPAVTKAFEDRADAIIRKFSTSEKPSRKLIEMGRDAAFLVDPRTFLSSLSGKGGYLTPKIWEAVRHLYQFDDSLGVDILKLITTKFDDPEGHKLAVEVLKFDRWAEYDHDTLSVMKDDEVKVAITVTLKSDVFRGLMNAEAANRNFSKPIIMSYMAHTAEKCTDESSQAAVVDHLRSLMASHGNEGLPGGFWFIVRGFKKVSWSRSVAFLVADMVKAGGEWERLARELIITRSPGTLDPLPRRFAHKMKLYAQLRAAGWTI
ncbi:hypothetical protein O9X98_06860 [Agrobacterium salinitolerans]|nr:hypothetical protein [Agrobacterium salinitolerans]